MFLLYGAKPIGRISGLPVFEGITFLMCPDAEGLLHTTTAYSGDCGPDQGRLAAWLDLPASKTTNRLRPDLRSRHRKQCLEIRLGPCLDMAKMTHTDIQ